MNIKIVKNKYFNAVFLLMLFSAVVHMVILFFLAMASGNMYLLNYFNIIGIGNFLPNFLNSFSGNIISFLLVVALYIIILKLNEYNESSR